MTVFITPTAKPLKFSNPRESVDARGVALRAPHTRPEKKILLCGVRKASASRSAIAPRTARSGESYPREAARAGTYAPAPCLPQEEETNLLCAGRGTASSRLRRTARCSASHARVAVGGRSCGGQLPRSLPAFFLSREKNIKRIFPGATAKDVRGNYNA